MSTRSNSNSDDEKKRRTVQVQRLSKEEFDKKVEERQRQTGMGEYGKGGTKDVRQEAVKSAEIKVEAERAVIDRKIASGGGLTAGGRREDGSRITSARGTRPTVSEAEVKQEEQRILQEKAQDEIQRQRQIEREGGPQQTPGPYARLAQQRQIEVERKGKQVQASEDIYRDRGTAETENQKQLRLKKEFEARTGIAQPLDAGEQRELTRQQVASLSPEDQQTYKSLQGAASSTAKTFLENEIKIIGATPKTTGTQIVIQGTTIVGGPTPTGDVKTKRSALSADLLEQVKSVESEGKLKYSGEVRFDAATGEAQPLFYDKAEAKRALEEYKLQLKEVRTQNAEIDAANAAEQKRFQAEEKKVYDEAKDLGYDIKRTETTGADGSTEYSYEYVPIKGKQQFEYVTDPKTGKEVKVTVDRAARFRATQQFEKEYIVKDASAGGQVKEFFTGAKAQVESYGELVGYQPTEVSGFNTLMGLGRQEGAYTKREGETDAQFRQRVRKEGAENQKRIQELAKGKPKKVVERGKGPVVSVDYTPGGEAYTQQQVFEAIKANPIRFAGEATVEGVAMAAGGGIISGGVKGATKVVKIVKAVIKPTAKTATEAKAGVTLTTKQGVSVAGKADMTTEVIGTRPKLAKPAEPKKFTVDNRGRFQKENIEREIKMDTAEPSAKPSGQKIAKGIKADLDETRTIEQRVVARPDADIRPTLESDIFIDVDKGFKSFKAGTGGGVKPPKTGGDGGEPTPPKTTKKVTTLKDIDERLRSQEGARGEGGTTSREGLQLIQEEKPVVKGTKKQKEQQVSEEIKQQVDDYHNTPQSLTKIYIDEVPKDPNLRLKVKKTQEVIKSEEAKINKIEEEKVRLEKEAAMKQEEIAAKEAELEAARQETLAAEQAGEKPPKDVSKIEKELDNLLKDQEAIGKDLDKVSTRIGKVRDDIEKIKERRKIKREEYLGAIQRISDRKIKKEGKGKLEQDRLAGEGIFGIESRGAGAIIGPSLGFKGETGFERVQQFKQKRKTQQVQEEQYVQVPEQVQRLELIITPKQGPKTGPKTTTKIDEGFQFRVDTTPALDVLTIPKTDLLTGPKSGLKTKTVPGEPKIPGPKTPPPREVPKLVAPPITFPGGGGGFITGKEPKELGGVGIKEYGVENILFESFSLKESGGFKYSPKELKERKETIAEDTGFADVNAILFGTGKGKKKGKKQKDLFAGLY